MREGIRASARLMPHLRHRHSRRGGARRPGYRHDLLHRQHPLRRRRRRGTLRLRLGPPRRGPHGYARRGRLGTPRGTRPDAPEHQTLSPNRRAGRPVRRLQGQNVVRDVAVVSFAQSTSFAPDPLHNEVEMLLPVVNEAVGRSGVPKKEIGFTVSGSCDYLAGAPFSFVSALDAVGAWPPIIESHVEMDGAWALYEAWVRLQVSDIDSALVYAFGKSSICDTNEILTLQHDPYYVAPLWPDPVSIAALQARALLESDGYSESDLANIVARSHKSAMSNSSAQRTSETSVEQLLSAPYTVSPLREHDCPPVSDGAAAVVLATGDLARRISERPA